MLPEDFRLGREKHDRECLTWSPTSALARFNLMQDGNPGWTRLFTIPSFSPPPTPSIHYSGATFPRHQPSPTGLSRQGFLPLLLLHPNYSLLPRQGHANHCYLGCITAPAPEQRGAVLSPDLAVQPFPAPHTQITQVLKSLPRAGAGTGGQGAGLAVLLLPQPSLPAELL